jgi:hypothetical protein
MLHPYVFKHNKIHRVQSFVNYIVLEVLCKPYIAPEFSPNIVHPKYKSLIDDVKPEYILTPLTEAFKICKRLYDSGQRKKLKILKKAVLQNNRIRELCSGDIEPVLYVDIEKVDETLSKNIKIFCDSLYKHSIKLEPFYIQFGKIDLYYKQLVGASFTCNACGRTSLLSKNNSPRSAFDHYLPKKHYPFSSINFKNLVPLCDICNESYKGQKDTLSIKEDEGKANEKTIKIKAFYPYRWYIPDIKIKLTFNVKYYKDIQPEEVSIQITCDGFEEETKNWIRLFGIEENYLSFVCSPEMYSYLEEYHIASHQGFDYLEMLKIVQDKHYNMTFLRIPFFEAFIS